VDVEEACSVGQPVAILRSLKREVQLGPVRRGEPRAHPLGVPGLCPRNRAGWSSEQAARGLGVSVRTYGELEDGKSPNLETWDRINGCD
jgi:Helix-turn-helix domain